MSDYGSKSGSPDDELKTLKEKLTSAEMKISDVNDA